MPSRAGQDLAAGTSRKSASKPKLWLRRRCAAGGGAVLTSGSRQALEHRLPRDCRTPSNSPGLTARPRPLQRGEGDLHGARRRTQPDLEAGVAAIRDVVKTLPVRPGVYRMLDARGDVLYVGKARALKNRVTNYTQVARLPKRLQRMVAQTRSMTDRHHQQRGRGAAARGAADQALPAALQCAAARRQKLPLHPAARGSRFPARPAPSRRAARQGAILRAVRQRGLGPQHAQRAAETVPAAELHRQLLRQPRPGPACSIRSAAARRPASAGSTRRAMPSWSATPRISSAASRPRSSRSSAR